MVNYSKWDDIDSDDSLDDDAAFNSKTRSAEAASPELRARQPRARGAAILHDNTGSRKPRRYPLPRGPRRERNTTPFPLNSPSLRRSAC